MKCAGWPGPCEHTVTRETERIFGELILCEQCYERAWDEWAEANRKAGPLTMPILDDEEFDHACALIAEECATMPIEQVRAELAQLGIDPQKTIDAVKRIVADATRRKCTDCGGVEHGGKCDPRME